jgi:predicted nucleic acid-binding protein
VRIAFDTNILAYAEGVNGAQKREAILAVIAPLSADAVHLPVQALGELFTILVRKATRSASQARMAIQSWRDAYSLIPTSPTVMLKAADIAADHHLGIWDAVMLAAATEAGCRLLLSEDMQDGFTWGGTTITNPFAPTLHPMLAAVLGSGEA